MSLTDIVFAAFDERRGPVPIFTTAREDLASKVAVKSIVSTLSQITTDTAEKIEGEAIIPFPDEKLIGFIYYTSLDEKIVTGDRRVISLSCLAPADKVNMLYTNAPMLSREARRIAEDINKKYQYGKDLQSAIKENLISWGKIEEEEEEEEEKIEEMDLFDLFKLYPTRRETRGFRRVTVDPLAIFMLGLLYNTPVVLVGSNPGFLMDVANKMDDIFEMKELRIELTIPIGEDATGWTHKIPRADIVALTTDQYKRSFFSKDPIVIITIDGEIKTPNHNFDDSHVNYMNKLFADLRSKKSADFALKALQLKLNDLTKRLEKLVNLAYSSSDAVLSSTSKRVIQDRLKLSSEELEILVEIIRGYKYISMSKVNRLLKPDKPYQDIWIQGPTTIGFIR